METTETNNTQQDANSTVKFEQNSQSMQNTPNSFSGNTNVASTGNGFLWKDLVVPFSIIIAGGLIALGIYFTGTKETKVAGVPVEQTNNQSPARVFAPIGNEDIVIGDPAKAKVTIIDYSDTSCPYCKIHHETLQKIYDEFGQDNRVAWVYRHLPIKTLHPNAPKEAEAIECVKDIAGNDTAWKYMSTIYQKSPSLERKQQDPKNLPIFAKELGVDVSKFESCLSSNKNKEKIDKAVLAGEAAGGVATPYTVLYINGKFEPLVSEEGPLGAIPYPTFKTIIQQALDSAR
jgi:protein-disulfide isomerase